MKKPDILAFRSHINRSPEDQARSGRRITGMAIGAVIANIANIATEAKYPSHHTTKIGRSTFIARIVGATLAGMFVGSTLAETQSENPK